MATQRCLVTLLSAGEFRALDPAEQAARLEAFMSDWFGLEPPDVVDVIRWIQRVRVHSAAVGVCVGDLVLELLREAKAMHDTRRAPAARACISHLDASTQDTRMHAEVAITGQSDAAGVEVGTVVPVEVESGSDESVITDVQPPTKSRSKKHRT